MVVCPRGDHEGTETGAHMETMQGDGCCSRGRAGCFGSTEFRHLTHNGGGGAVREDSLEEGHLRRSLMGD